MTNHGWIRLAACICFCLGMCIGVFAASPVDFGTAELDAAIDSRNFKYKPKIMAELDIEAPETFRIELYAAGGAHITGGDLRGLMYGLLEAAEQMRATGRLKKTHGVPALALRGVRIDLNGANQTNQAWFTSVGFWQDYLSGMARNRLNRVELAFDANPGPEAFPVIRSITQIAQQYGVDVAIGFGAPSAVAIKDLLANCPTVRAVVLHGASFPTAAELLPVLHDAGRRVVLELPDNDTATGLIETAGESGAPLRLYAPYSETAMNPRPRDSYWEMDVAQGPDAVNAISGAGFEVHATLNAGGVPILNPIAAWGRFGYSRPME